jgi:hypothetical protein
MQAHAVTSRLQVGRDPGDGEIIAVLWNHRRQASESEPKRWGKLRGSSGAALRRISRRTQPADRG